jgi:DNA polymerase V
MTARELVCTMIKDVLKQTGITATAGIGTNLYLCKIAMDITAKHAPADADGVRIAELDEPEYRRTLWTHQPLTDFWRVGGGTARRLAQNGMYTLGDVARRSVYDEESLYRLFGVDAGILIDHAWGYEPCEISDIKNYRSDTNCLSSGQVLQCPYDCTKARIIVREMTDLLVLDMVEKGVVADSFTLVLGFDRCNVDDGTYRGDVVLDHYGRTVPKPAHGTANFGRGACPLRPHRPSVAFGAARDYNGKPPHARGLRAVRPVHRPHCPGKGAPPSGDNAFHQEKIRKERHPKGNEFGEGRHHHRAERSDRRTQKMKGSQS